MNEQICRTFKAVSEHRSISRAARVLNLSQSAVSQQIHQMEQEYGCMLLVRGPQGVHLNEVGDMVYTHVTQLLHLLDQSREEVRSHLEPGPARLSVGASLTIAEYLFPHVLPRLDNPVDRQHLTLYMANSHDVADRVAQGELDLGLVEAPVDDTRLAVRPFLEDRLKLVVSHQHRWNGREQVNVEELCNEPLVVREPGSGTRMVTESALAQLGIGLSQLNVRFVLGTTQAIKAMISQNIGVAILSPYTILPHERPYFHLLDIAPLRLMRHLSVIHSTERLQPAAERLIRVLFAMDWPNTLA